MRTYYLPMCLLLLLSACGELTYKRGATDRDLSNSKKQCQTEASKSETAVSDCLKNKGWSVHQLNEMDLFAVATVTPNQGQIESEEKGGLLANGADDTTNLDTQKAPENTNQTANQVANSAKKQAKSQTPKKPVITSNNPLDTYQISSWWKMGRDRSGLEKDMQNCETELGVAHKPDHKTQTYTLGMLVCMHQKGWKALKK